MQIKFPWFGTNRKPVTVCYLVQNSRFAEERRYVFTALCSLECQHQIQYSNWPVQAYVHFWPAMEPANLCQNLPLNLNLVEWKISRSDECKVGVAAYSRRDHHGGRCLRLRGPEGPQRVFYLLPCALVTWQCINGCELLCPTDRAKQPALAHRLCLPTPALQKQPAAVALPAL